MATQDNNQSIGKIILTFIGTILVGVIIGAAFTYKYITTNYYEVHNSNIGGFIFKGGKVFSLEELKDY